MTTHTKALSLFASFVLLCSSAVRAEPVLSLDEAIRLATQNQPLLQSYDQASAASREAAIAASQLPDPRLKVGVVNLPITGNDTARFNRDDMTMSTVGVMQEMVPAAKREAAFHAGEAAAEQYQTEKSVTARSIQRDVALAWLDVYEAQRRSELYQRISQEMVAERKVMLSRISSGAVSSTEVLKLDAELSMSNDKKLTAILAERKARATLSRWIGSAAQRPMANELPVFSINTSPESSATEIEHHPLLQNAEQMEAVAQSEADQAKAEHELNWSWEVMYGRRRSDLSDMVTFQVAVDLPWDRANRQDKRAAEKLILVEKARQLTEDRRRELNAELESAEADADTAKAREEEHQQRLIPAAESRLSVTQAGYEAGKGNLSEVWDARRALLEVEMEHWVIMTDMQRAAVKLGYLLNNTNLYSWSQP
ncbi:TolC family protein [Methyloradius palustris]|uniref:Transporter n=1 Tax=Methyloradius palustris TaxID=2778876 RepID=A0A8D5GA19_9PROT|nr:TolC family protein [Methyloradius palustris]BCM24391.1 transporter [Methyloradius palustris]